jgi:acyl-CoA hydrolase
MDSALAATKTTDLDAFVALAQRHGDVIVPLANGEPDVLLSALDAAGDRMRGVRVHQMHALRDRRYMHGEFPGLRYTAYFLSDVSRAAYAGGGCDFTPAHFSEMPHILRHVTTDPIVAAAASPPDKHGWFTLGTNADYVASFIGKAPFFLEVNPNMPRTQGENAVHVSQIAGWIEADYPLTEVLSASISDKDRVIGGLIAERVPDGATIQIGIGSIPSSLLDALSGHRDLGVHTELFSDGLARLFEAGVITGTKKVTRTGKMVVTFALGSRALYDFIDSNEAVEFLPVNWVNNPRVIGQEPNFVSVNATLEVDIFGQANSEIINGKMWSGSGGQADFAHGAMFAPGGQGFLALHSTNSDESISRIKVRLGEGALVTTLKNAVDHVVTEYGIAELHGQPVSVRARRLIDIAHPKFRDELEAEARRGGFLRD